MFTRDVPLLRTNEQRDPGVKGLASTKDVLDHHLKCFGEGNLEGILADYSSDAVLFIHACRTAEGSRRSSLCSRPCFQSLQSLALRSLWHQQGVEGDYAYILWMAETADNSYDAATETFVVRNGKIVAQSFAAKITPKRGRIYAKQC